MEGLLCNLHSGDFRTSRLSVNGNTLILTFALNCRLLSSLTISISAVSSSSALQQINTRKITKEVRKNMML
jgi:hypothetical protein